MKRIIFALCMGMAVTACQKVDVTTDENGNVVETSKQKKTFTFHVKGDFTTL